MDLELAKLRYESHGFLHLPQMLDAAIIGRLRVAFDRTAAAYQETWKNEIALGHADPRFCDIPDIMDCDDAFVDVIDQPEMIPLLLKLVGQDVQLNHTHARLFPPG